MLSYYTANKLLDLTFGRTGWTPPAAHWAAVLLQDPLRDASAVLEPSSGNYGRFSVTANLTNFPAASLGQKALAVEHAGMAATGLQGTATHFGWFDDDGTPSGNLLSYVALPTPEVIDTPDIFLLAAGLYSASIAGTMPNGGGISYYLANKWLDHWLSAQTFSAAVTLYAFLSYSDPLRDGTGIAEPSGFSYARKAVTNNTSQFGSAALGQKDNDLEIAFAAASGGSWGVPLYYGFIDSASGAGNLYSYSPILTPKTVNAGTIFRIPAGKLIAALG